MKINIKSEKLELTEPIRNYLQKKVNVLEKFINADNNKIIAHAIIGKTTKHHAKGNYFEAEIKISTPGKDFFTKIQKDDLYAAIDEAKDILKRDIIKHKETLIGQHQRS